ncbi:MAG: TolC family protein [Candidatus Omnitrophica bacterium]|nr:TolC family protein [Candidatus Omnitrophota bacterium]
MKAKKIINTIMILFFLSLLPIIAKAEDKLSWLDCVKEAAKNNPDLIAAEQVVKQSEAGKNITASALYPQVDASLNASTAKSSSASGKSTADNYSYGVSANQLIFDGTRTINDVRAAAQNILASKQGYRFTSVSLRQSLRSAFIALLRVQGMLNITQEIYNIRRSNLELIALRYESGLEHKGAFLTAEADLAEAVYGIAQAKREVEVAQRELVKEMGRQKLTPISVKGDFEVKDRAMIKPDLDALAKNNPSLQQAIAQKNAANFSLKSTYANFSPSLSAQAGVNKKDVYWSPKYNQWNLGLVLSMPIFEGGLRFAQVSQAKALLNQLKASERSTKDGIVLTLEQAWAELQDTIDYVGVQKKQLTAAEERSKIAQAQYSIGFISFDNWTIIEDNLVKAKRAYIDAQALALYAEANWIQAKGETLEYEN